MNSWLLAVLILSAMIMVSWSSHRSLACSIKDIGKNGFEEVVIRVDNICFNLVSDVSLYVIKRVEVCFG